VYGIYSAAYDSFRRRFFEMVYGKLIIDGNAVYEIDEDCMEKRREYLRQLEHQEEKGKEGGKRRG